MTIRYRNVVIAALAVPPIQSRVALLFLGRAEQGGITVIGQSLPRRQDAIANGRASASAVTMQSSSMGKEEASGAAHEEAA